MLTFLINNIKHNCFEIEESKIRDWSKNGDMTCINCGKRIIYNHGEIRDFIYLRHFRKTDECNCEKDCEEHDQGKLLIYNHLKNINGISKLELEYKVETGQVADIYFEYNNKKYCVEYQCTPIATPLLQRSRKYKNAGYEVLWIFGTTNYDIKNYINNSTNFSKRYKTIASEREIMFEWDMPVLYFNPNKNRMYQISFNTIKSIPKRTTLFDLDFEVNYLEVFDFTKLLNNTFYSSVKNNIINWLESICSLNIIDYTNTKINVNPLVCCNFEGITYAIEYIRKPINNELYKNIVEEYKKNKVIPIILQDSTLNKIDSERNYIAYSILDKYFYNPETNEISIISHIGSQVWFGYMCSYNMQVYNPCITKLNECWFVDKGLENKLSNENSFKKIITNKKYLEMQEINKLIKNQKSILEYAEYLRGLDTELILVDGNFVLQNYVCFNDINYITKDLYRDYISNNLQKIAKQNNYSKVYLLINKTIEGQSISNHRRSVILNKLKQYGFNHISFYKEDVNGSK